MSGLTALEQVQSLNHSLLPAPSNFTASHPSPRGILLSWEQPPLSPSIQIYILFLWLLNARIATNYSISNDVLSYRVQSLEPYSLYQTTLTALKHDENFTQFTQVIAFRTNESTPISFPIILSVSIRSYNAIYVTWSHLLPALWRGAPYKYRVYWQNSDTEEDGYELVSYPATSYEITGLKNGVIYSIRISALTEFGGVGPSSPQHPATPTAIYPLSSPLQYTAIPVIVIFAISLAYIVYVFKRLCCTFQGLSASWFKQQKKHYQLLTQSDDKHARQSPLLLRNTKASDNTPEYTNRELCLEISPLEAPPKARSVMTLQSDGSYSQLPTPIRPVSALNVMMHANSNRKQASSTLDPRTQLQPSSAHRISTTDRGIPSNSPLTEINRINPGKRFNVRDNR